MSFKTIFKNKKILWSTIGAGTATVGAVAGGVAGGLSNSNQTVQHENTIDVNLKNDAISVNNFVSKVEIKVSKLTVEEVESKINDKLIQDIKKEILADSTNFANITLDYEDNSLNYANNKFSVIFESTPIEGHSWEDFTDESKNILVTLDNVILISDTTDPEKPVVPSIKNDAATLSDDIFSEKLVLEYENNSSLQTVVKSNEQNIINTLLKNEGYKNVELAYKDGSAVFNSTDKNSSYAIFNAKPIEGHAWKSDLTTGVKEVKVIFNNISVEAMHISETINYSLPSFTTFESKTRAINYIFELNAYDFGYAKRIPTFIENKFKTIKVNKLVSADITARNQATGIYEVQPKDGYKWSDGTTGTRKIKVLVDNFVMNLLEKELNTLNYVLPGYLEFDSNQEALDAIFKTGGYHGQINDVVNYIENNVPYLNVTRLISTKIVSDKHAIGVYGIKPEPGFLWTDGTTDEIELTVNVSNFFMNTVSVESALNYELEVFGVYDSEQQALDHIFGTNSYNNGGKNQVVEYIENNYGLKVNKILSSKLINNNAAEATYEVSLKDGYKWFDNSTSKTKEVKIVVTNFKLV